MSTYEIGIIRGAMALLMEIRSTADDQQEYRVALSALTVLDQRITAEVRTKQQGIEGN